MAGCNRATRSGSLASMTMVWFSEPAQPEAYDNLSPPWFANQASLHQGLHCSGWARVELPRCAEHQLPGGTAALGLG